MNLVLVNYEYPPLGGGAGNATAHLARSLARLGHHVTVISGAFRDLPRDEQEQSGVRVIRLATRRRRIDRSNYGEMLSFVFAAARYLPKYLHANPADGLIVFFSLPCGPLGLWARWRSSTPYVISLRGGDVPGAEARVGSIHRVLAPLRRAVLRNADAVVANSIGLAQLSERADPVSVKVITNGVDTEFFSPAQPRAATDCLHLLFAGRFQPQKNLLALLDQFANAIRRCTCKLQLTLVGDGPQRELLQARASALGIADVVSWRGWLNKEQLREAYRAADVFVNPSLYEGMPNTVLEAMACGLPVIASRVIGNDELVVSGETGVLFDLSHRKALADAIVDLSQQSDLRGRMATIARERACERYSWSAAANRYAELFQGN